jgi:hypothetical protein
MNCILYLTDFSEQSHQALNYLLPVADELRARIIFVHLLMDDELPAVQKVQKYEEAECLPFFNRLKQAVVQYGYRNNCSMLTGHRLCKGRLKENIAKLLKSVDPYAVVIHREYSENPWFRKNSIADQLLQSVSVPLLIIPVSSSYTGILRIGYFSAWEDLKPEQLRDILHKIQMFRSSLCLFILTADAGALETIQQETEQQVPEVIDNERISFFILNPTFIHSRIVEKS